MSVVEDDNLLCLGTDDDGRIVGGVGVAVLVIVVFIIVIAAFLVSCLCLLKTTDCYNHNTYVLSWSMVVCHM